MIYASHLIADNEMQEIIEQTGMGVESTIFPLQMFWITGKNICPEYKEEVSRNGHRTSYAAWSVSGSESGGV